MKCNLLSLLLDLSEQGLLTLNKEGEDLRVECESYLNSIVKRRRGRPRKEQSVNSKKSEDVIGRLLSSNGDIDDDPIKVKKIVIGIETYLISETNILYSPSSHEEIGSYHNNNLLLDA